MNLGGGLAHEGGKPRRASRDRTGRPALGTREFEFAKGCYADKLDIERAFAKEEPREDHLPARAKIERHSGVRPPRVLAASQDVGGAWLDGGDGLALVVPSVLVPQEKNYVSNAHAQFAGVRVANTEPFGFDERLRSARR